MIGSAKGALKRRQSNTAYKTVEELILALLRSVHMTIKTLTAVEFGLDPEKLDI